MSAVLAALFFGLIGAIVVATGLRMRRNESTFRGRRGGWSTKVLFIGSCFLALSAGLLLGI